MVLEGSDLLDLLILIRLKHGELAFLEFFVQ